SVYCPSMMRPNLASRRRTATLASCPSVESSALPTIVENAATLTPAKRASGTGGGGSARIVVLCCRAPARDVAATMSETMTADWDRDILLLGFLIGRTQLER